MVNRTRSTSSQMANRGRNSTWISSEDPLFTISAGSLIAERYEVLEYLGSGASAAVYKCKDTLLGNLIVAVKIIPNSIISDQVALRRLYRELLTNFDFDHPNIARFYDSVRADDYIGLVMEYVAGGSLAGLFDSGHIFHFEEIRTILVQICVALEAIHSAGIVHRDMKLENVLFTKEGVVKVADFGLAKEYVESGNIGTDLKNSGDFAMLRTDPSARHATATGGIAGSPLYLAPEYISKGIVNAQSDIYAVGIIGYQLIAGCEPYPCEDLLDMFKAKLSEKPESLMKLRPDTPWELCQIIDNAIEIDPSNRYKDIRKMRYALERLVLNGPLLVKTRAYKSALEEFRITLKDEPVIPEIDNAVKLFGSYGTLGYVGLTSIMNMVGMFTLLTFYKVALFANIKPKGLLPEWINEMIYYLS
jgi:serine/threonine protein kinase